MNISLNNPIIIIGITITAVIVFNLMLFLRFRNRRPNNDIEMMSSLINKAKNPWEKAEKDLDDLAKLVRQAEESSKNDDASIGES